MAATSKPISIALSGTVTYFFLIVALVGSVILSYGIHLFPTAFGDVGIGTAIVGIVSYLTHDLESTHTPKGLPSYTTFVVVSVASAAFASVGYFTSSTFITLSATLVWLVAIVSFINTYLKENGSSSLTSSEVSWATAIIGASLAFLTWYQGDLTASGATVLVTLITTFSQYIHLSETSSGVSVSPS